MAAVRDAIRLKYITLITHGGMLTPERARSLWDAGINQFNISLDYLDGRHDTARGIPGLTAKIFATVAAMRARGIDGSASTRSSRTTTSTRSCRSCSAAAELGVRRELQRLHRLQERQRDVPRCATISSRRVDALVAELLAFKRRAPRRHHQLRLLPRADPALRARRDDGAVPVGDSHDPHRSDGPREALSRLPDGFPLADFKEYEPIDCNACYYACRGEAQAPLQALARAGRDGVSPMRKRLGNRVGNQFVAGPSPVPSASSPSPGLFVNASQVVTCAGRRARDAGVR